MEKPIVKGREARIPDAKDLPAGVFGRLVARRARGLIPEMVYRDQPVAAPAVATGGGVTIPVPRGAKTANLGFAR